MSILLIGAEGEVGAAVIGRLLGQGDEVRVVEDDPGRAERWRTLGAHVAPGTWTDQDLVERAAQNVRTIAVLQELDTDAVIEGAVAARVGRLVLCTHDFVEKNIESEDLDYVVLIIPRSRFGRRLSLQPESLAEAIDAADDLAGHPRLIADLRDETGWRELGLPRPL